MTTVSFQSKRTLWSLMVMPRSLSRSMVSRYWARISRGSTAPQSSSIRSARVDLPWSMWAMIDVLRNRERSMSPQTVPADVGSSATARAARNGQASPPRGEPFPWHQR